MTETGSSLLFELVRAPFAVLRPIGSAGIGVVFRHGCWAAETRRGPRGGERRFGAYAKGRGEVLFLSTVFLLGTVGQPGLAQTRKPEKAADDLAAITVELRWSAQDDMESYASHPTPRAGTDVTLTSSEGRVADVIAWPGAAARGRPKPGRDGKGTWRIGRAASGCVRARLEVPATADLVIRRGDGLVRIPIAAVLERPQQTPSQAPLAVSVERLSWDSLRVDLGPGASRGGLDQPPPSGLAAVHILWPDVPEATVRTTAVLRPMNGGETVWHHERREAVRKQSSIRPNGSACAGASLTRAIMFWSECNWAAAGARESTRLSRLIRRRKSCAGCEYGDPVIRSGDRRSPRSRAATRRPGAPGRRGRGSTRSTWANRRHDLPPGGGSHFRAAQAGPSGQPS